MIGYLHASRTITRGVKNIITLDNNNPFSVHKQYIMNNESVFTWDQIILDLVNMEQLKNFSIDTFLE